MDAATLQSKVFSGYSRAAQRIGYDFTVYRPSSVTNPIMSGNIVINSINAAFAPRSTGYKFDITSEYKTPLFHGLFDATNINVGDYLQNTSHGTYFVAAKQDIGPILCVQCNNIVSVVRATTPSTPGTQSYIGASTSTESAVIISWPASLIIEARGRNTGAALPMDEVNPYFILLLPAYGQNDIRTSDIVIDGNVTPPRRYIISAAERSPLGWRCITQLAAS